jgi:type ISP restriction-modification system protein
MKLHVGYESVTPAKLKRIDISDDGVRKSGVVPKALLKADKEAGRILIDGETTLAGIPSEAWQYQLGNRTALEWVLDQYKERKPKDPTIREKFDTYRFADYKEKVIDLIISLESTPSVSIPCWQTTPAGFWRSTSTRNPGRKTQQHSLLCATELACLQRWSGLGLGRAVTSGFSSISPSRRCSHETWVPLC